MSSHIAADLIRDAWRHFIYETSACFDGFYCFVRVRKAPSDLVCDDNERSVSNFRKNSLDPLRHITSDANEDRVILQMAQSGDIVTLMFAYGAVADVVEIWMTLSPAFSGYRVMRQRQAFADPS